MGITMLAVFTAFVSVLFGYFFYWTLDERFLRDAAHGPARRRAARLERPGGRVVGAHRRQPPLERR